jgi:hypothetical protein
MRDENWEWDDKKALSNIREHDVSFEQAKAVFDDTWNIEIIDDREDYVDLNGDPEERINMDLMPPVFCWWLLTRCGAYGTD